MTANVIRRYCCYKVDAQTILSELLAQVDWVEALAVVGGYAIEPTLYINESDGACAEICTGVCWIR